MTEPALADPGWYATARHELDRDDAAISLAQAATNRLRRVLRPGTADSVASMLLSDLESAAGRVAWLRARLEAELGEAA